MPRAPFGLNWTTRIGQIATLTLLATGLMLLVTGCGSTAATGAAAATQAGTPTGGQSNPTMGQLHGGQQSVTGAHIYLFAVGTSGYGGLSTSLIRPASAGARTDLHGTYLLSDQNGFFDISNTYACTPGQITYLLAQGGNPGLASGATNPALTLTTAFPPCDGSGRIPVDSVNVTEVTTVATAYAFAGYMTDIYHLSSPPTDAAQQGLVNAFLTFNTIVDPNSGTANFFNAVGNGTVPQTTVNTIANMLAACVNSTGNTTPCNTLFTNTRDPGGALPTDTASAALNLAHNPGANVTPLFNLAVPNPPYQPSLTLAPNDWTLGITYYADLMAGPYYPAFDAEGNLWVPGYANDTVTEFNPLGIPISGNNGFSGNGLNQPYAIAIDSAQGVWVANYAYGATANVARFNPNGSGGGSYACGTNCTGVAVDKAQNIWTVANSGSTTLRNSGAALAQFITSGTAPGIAIDSAGRAWTIGKGRSLLRLTLPSTVDTFPQTVTSTLANDLNLLAIDSADNIWFTSGKNNAIGRVDSNGKLISPATGYTGGGLNYPAQLAIDGANRVWVANRDGNSISAFRNDGTPISPATGYKPSGQAAPDPTIPITAVGVKSPHGLAIDAAGNVWVTNFVANSVTEFVGIAAPVVTPITPTNHGQRP